MIIGIGQDMCDIRRIEKSLAEFGDRCFWGTDWPHPNLAAIPDDGVLTDLLLQIAPTRAALQALMVDNPARFYGFPPR